MGRVCLDLCGGHASVEAPEMSLALSRNVLAEVSNVYPPSCEFWLR